MNALVQIVGYAVGLGLVVVGLAAWKWRKPGRAEHKRGRKG